MGNSEQTRQATDMEISLFWVGLIDNPYTDIDGLNARNLYIRLVKYLLPSIGNEHAKEFLEAAIRKYEKH